MHLCNINHTRSDRKIDHRRSGSFLRRDVRGRCRLDGYRLGRQFRRVIAVAPVGQRLKYIFALQFIPKGV